MVKFRKKTRRKFKKKGGTRYLCSEVRKQNPTLKEPNIESSIPYGPRKPQGRLRPLMRSPTRNPRKPSRNRLNPDKTEIQGQPKRASEIQLAKPEDTGLAGPLNPPKLQRASTDPESYRRKRELGLQGSPTKAEKKRKEERGTETTEETGQPKRASEIQGQPKRASEIQLAKPEDTGLAGPLNPPKLQRASTDPESYRRKRELGLQGSPTKAEKKRKKKTGTETTEETGTEKNGGSKKRKRRKQKKTRKARGIIDDLRELCTTGRCGRPRPQRPTLRELALNIEQDIIHDLNKNEPEIALTSEQRRNIKAAANHEAARIVNNSRSASKKKKKKKKRNL